MQKAIIVGATSGMGKELAYKLADNNFKVGIIGRREKLLQNIVNSNPKAFIAKAIDISKPETPFVLDKMVEKLGGLDLIIVTAGFGEPYERLNNHITQKIININIIGFTNIVDWALSFFLKQGKGHLVSFSSVAGIRGSGIDPAYCASNSFQMNYLEGLRQNIHQSNLPVYITDVRPGFVEKETTGVQTRFWITSLNKATQQIYRAITKRKKVVYISKRWSIVAFFLLIIPRSLYLKLLSRYTKPVKPKTTLKIVKTEKPVIRSLVS